MMIVVAFATRSAYQVERNAIYEEMERLEKSQLEDEVNEIINYIELSETKATEAMRDELKRRVDEAYVIAYQIYNRHGDGRSKDQIETMIIEALRPFRYDDGTGYIFMDRFNGDVMLYPIVPEFEGTNIIDLKDDFGNFVIRDEINTAKNFNSGFAEGHWFKPNQENNQESGSLKVSYIRRFEGLDWYIGSGIYEDEYLENLKINVLEDLNKFKVTQDRTLKYFISNNDGELLLKDQKIITETEFISEAYKTLAMQSPNGEYVQELSVDGTNEYVSLTYLKAFEPWNWIVGYETRLTENVSASKAYYLEGVQKNLGRLSFTIGMSVLLVLIVFMKFFSAQLVECFNSLETVITTGKRPNSNEKFCFKEFEDAVRRIEMRPPLNESDMSSKKNEPIYESTKIDTIVEGEAVAAGVVRVLNEALQNDDLEQETQLKLERLGKDMTGVRKLLMRMSQNEDDGVVQEKMLNFERFTLKSHFEDIMELVELEYKGRLLESRIICDKDLNVYSDPMLLSQIVTHLATNSVCHGFTDKTDKTGIITIEVIYDDEYLRIYFSDNGVGMASTIQERIFEPYFTTSAMKGDSGLGLTEVYNLVNDSLGGSINCSSREGYGTDFYIDIPGVGPGLWLREPDEEIVNV